MITASVSQTKNNLSALLDRVKQGQTILILDRQSPVATLSPANQWLGEGDGEHLKALVRQGLVRLPIHKPDRKVLNMPIPRTKDGSSVVAALLEERQEGR